jgi:DMSO/TMAO reductase YedYZ molybdopterin-dependent catalytic subunit
MEEVNTIISPDTLRKNRIPPGQYQTTRWPVLHYGAVPQISKTNWSLRLFGLVTEEKIIGYNDLLALPGIKVKSDIHCVTTWSLLDNLWEGISVNEIKNRISISSRAQFVIVHAANNFTTNLTLTDFFQSDVLLAVKHNNQEISAEHGGPVRLVVPRLYFWKSAKWITGLEFTDVDKPGFWERAGYHNHGDPWKEERYG